MNVLTHIAKQFAASFRPWQACILSAASVLLLDVASAERILYESFETPVVLEGATDPDGWDQGGGHPSYRRAANESGQNWSTPFGEQGMSTYSNGVGLKDLGYMPYESGEYVLKFNITSSAAIGEYRVEFLTQDDLFGDLQPEVMVAHQAGDTDGSKDMSFAGELRWRREFDPENEEDFIPKKLLIKLMQDPDRSNWRHTPIWDNVSVDWIPDVDSEGPTVEDIVDDKDGATVAINSLVTYTVTFNEAMDPATVEIGDFGNAGSADVTIESVTPISNDTVFLVEARPTSGGTLRLRINAGADLDDAVGNPMETFSAIQDNVTIIVDATNPVLLPGDIVDDQGGGTIPENTVVTYTLTFSRDMNAATVGPDDFENAGTAPIASIVPGDISETSPGVFTVGITPTGSGTLQFKVKDGVLLEGAGGGILDTTPGIVDDTTIIVDSTPPTLAPVDITDDTEGSPVAVGTLVAYDVIFSEDMDESTVTAADFGNAVTVGDATFTIDSVEETTPGVFRIEVTPSSPGSIQLQVNAGALLTDENGNALVTSSAIVDDSTVTVEVGGDPYASWSGGLAFEGDDNEDGVTDGMAWLLGVSAPSVGAQESLPTTSMSSGQLVLSFRCLKTADRGGASLRVQYCTDLGATPGDSWSDNEAEVPDTDSTVNGIIFDTTDEGDVIHVSATIPAQAGGRVFARLAGDLP